MSKAVIYTRVSTHDQVDNYSLENQERECRIFCEQQGLSVVRLYREEGESAKTANRTQLQRMLKDLVLAGKKEEISVVVIYRVDRLARETSDYGAIRASLYALNINVRSVMETFDDTPAGRFIETVIAGAAQFDNDVRAQRSTEGMKAGVASGRWMWRPPIGYITPKDVPASLAPHAELGPLVKEVFLRIAAGETTSSVRQALGSVGLCSKKSGAMSPQTFGNMLKNPLYKGLIVCKKWDLTVKGDFEPLVSEELFDQVQWILNPSKKPSQRKRADNPDFPLRRYVQCGVCGKFMTASWSTGRNGKFGYYTCYKKDCRKVRARKEVVETLFVEFLADLSVSPKIMDLMDAVVRDVWNQRFNSLRLDQSRLERKIEAAQGMLDSLFDKYLSGSAITQEMFETKSQQFKDEIDLTRQELTALSLPKYNIDEVIAFARELLTDLPGCWNRLDPQLRSGFARAVVPTGVTLMDGAVRTATLPWYVTAFSGSTSDQSILAVPAGFEPTA